MTKTIGLLAGNANLDARLLALRRRLAKRGEPIQLWRCARGQLEFVISTAMLLITVCRIPEFFLLLASGIVTLVLARKQLLHDLQTHS